MICDADLAREWDVTFYLGRHDESVTIPTWALERFSHAEVVPLAERTRLRTVPA